MATMSLFPSSGTPLVNGAAIQAGLSSVLARTHEGDERLLAAWAIQQGIAGICMEIHGQRMPSAAKDEVIQRAHDAVDKVRRQMAGLSPGHKLALLATFSKGLNEEACGEELWRR